MRLPQVLHADIGDLGDVARRVWSWWLGELRSMLPASINGLLRPVRKCLLVTAGDDQLFPQRIVELQQGSQLRFSPMEARGLVRPTLLSEKSTDPSLLGAIVCLPSSQVARKRLRYPRTSAANLRRMIELDLDKVSPLEAQLVYFGFRVEPPLAGELAKGGLQAVDIWICRRDTIDSLLALCNTRGLKPFALTTSADLAVGLAITNILPKRPLGVLQRLYQFRIPLLLGLSLGLVFAISIAIQLREASLQARLEKELVARRALVQTIEKERAEVQRLQRRTDFLPRTRKTLHAGAALAELARVLPDNAWIYSLELNKNELRIRGLSSRANELLAVIDASPAFSATQFKSAIVAAPENAGERFDIATTVGAVK